MSNFAQLSTEAKSIFNSLARKGEWTAEEAFEHLVPEQLQDDSQKVLVWMNGGEITVTRTIGDRGAAGGGYTETETIVMPDRDCSRIKAGGDYSVDNTIMEDMSANRARGAVDITDEELADIVASNEAEASLIDMGDIEDLLPTAAENLEEVADMAALGEAAEVASGFLDFAVDAIAPVAGGVWAAKVVADRCETVEDKVGWGSLAGGGTVLALLTPPGQVAIGGYLLYKVGKRGHAMWQRHQARKSR